ncbi:MAG: hypothetical protein HYX92_00490 [Chloroflexi bacterium]|nr:hypothetical protein [Chloroflexota bacterium]
MRVRYYVDPETGLSHICNHRITEGKVCEVLRVAREDRPAAEGARMAIGRTNGGRYLRIVYVPDREPDSLFVITGYDLGGKALIAYRRRLRSKGTK